MERIIRYFLLIVIVCLLIFVLINRDVLIDRLFDFRDQLHTKEIEEHIVGSVSPDNDIIL